MNAINCIFLLLITVFSIGPAFAEGYPEVWIESLDLTTNPIGIVASEGNNWEVFGDPKSRRYFYELDPLKWTVTEIKKEKFSVDHVEGNFVKVVPFDYNGLPTMTFSDGTKVTSSQTDCEAQEEGGPVCDTTFIHIGKKKEELFTSPLCQFGCVVTAAERWNKQIWVGLGHMGELQAYGNGLHVFGEDDLEHLSGILGKSENRGETAREMLPSLIRKDPKADRIWVGSNFGLRAYDQKFKRLGKCDLKPSTKKAPFSISCSKD